MNKHIVLVGGNGAIGRALQEGFRANGDSVTVISRATRRQPSDILLDASDYPSLQAGFPMERVDCLVCLMGSPVNSVVLVPPESFDEVTNSYLKSFYNVLWLGKELGIPRVILASSNHAADIYEQNGFSVLGRPINTQDYPYSKGLYGVYKGAIENLAQAFYRSYGLSVINLRIGSYRADERVILEQERYMRTWVSKGDLIDAFVKAAETEIPFGTYYVVSENPDCPWDITSAKEELGFRPGENSVDAVRRLSRGEG